MKFPDKSLIKALLDAPVRAGIVVWIGVRPARKASMLACDAAVLVTGQGVEGDRYRSDRGRQVTLIAAEDLAAIAAFLGSAGLAPELLRRNIVTRGINLSALKSRRFRLGPALLETAGECAPCSRMEDTLGPGGYNAVRGHGGITARILEGGKVRIGDLVARDDAA